MVDLLNSARHQAVESKAVSVANLLAFRCQLSATIARVQIHNEELSGKIVVAYHNDLGAPLSIWDKALALARQE